MAAATPWPVSVAALASRLVALDVLPRSICN
jgi:hypothetical protein